MNLNESELLQEVKGNLNGPYVRNLYLKRAQDEFNAGNILSSVFYQTEALCLGYRCKYPGNNANFNQINPYSCHSNSTDILQDELIKFADKEIKSATFKEPRDELIFQTDPKKGIESVQKFCQLLPKEWTLLQLTKNFNANTSISLKSEIITSEDSIFLTVLKNTQHDLYSDPICFKIDMRGSSGYVFTKFKQLSDDLRNKSKYSGEDSKVDKAKYWTNMDSVDSSIRSAVDELNTLIGPWKCFFTGQVLPSYRKCEDVIFKDVKKFCADNNLNTREYVILSSLARQTNLLTANDISLACSELTTDSELSQRIRKYLLLARDKNKGPLQCLPCIIIVDEVMDHFFWEMLNPQQELCRLSSFNMLKSLYFKYEDKISNGYVKLSIDDGKWIVNPDKTLNQMEKRISKFISYWVPHFDCLIGQVPTADDIVTYLTASDIFLYSGHGSGLQFFNGHRITKVHSNSVVFLLGCDSTRLNSDGLHSEMFGSHLYYFATLCPAVIGSILIALDRQMDNMTARILSTWLPSKQKVQWENVDLNLWLQDSKITARKNIKNIRHIYEPRLSLIISKLRSNYSEKFYVKTCLVYRGLPVWNINAEQKEL